MKFNKESKTMALLTFSVIIWHRIPSTPVNLFERILEKAIIAPYESTQLEGFRDIHWRFSNVEDAIKFAESLLEFASLEDVTKLTVIGESIGRKVYKDTMALLQK
jgi:hypothetical protein